MRKPRMLAFGVAVVLTFLISTALPAQAYVTGNGIYNDGQSWAECNNRYTVADIYNSSRTGRMQVFGCSNGFFVRGSTTSKAKISVVFERTKPWWRQEIRTAYAYGVMTNLMAKRSGWCYYAYVNAVGREFRWCG